MIVTEDLKEGQLRLLEVDQRLLLPVQTRWGRPASLHTQESKSIWGILLFWGIKVRPPYGGRWCVVHGSTRRGALWAAPALLFWQPEVRVAAHHVTAALHVLNVVG